MYYITFNTALVAAGAGLLKLGDYGIVTLFIAGIFVLGCFSSIIGILALRKGHQYYLRAIYKKTLIEDVLGLTAPIREYSGDANLAIGTTAGQTRRTRILYQTDEFLTTGLLRRGSIVFYLACFLGLLSSINLVGVAAAVAVYLTHRQSPYIPWP